MRGETDRVRGERALRRARWRASDTFRCTERFSSGREVVSETWRESEGEDVEERELYAFRGEKWESGASRVYEEEERELFVEECEREVRERYVRERRRRRD